MPSQQKKAPGAFFRGAISFNKKGSWSLFFFTRHLLSSFASHSVAMRVEEMTRIRRPAMNARNILVLLLVAAVATGVARAEDKIRIGVLGDSISKNRNAMGGKGWPLYLGKMLGKGYDVRTFSANGTDCLRVPSISIWSKSELPKLMRFQPSIVIIMLSANSARKGVKQYASRYGGDYGYTIEYVRRGGGKPKVYCCRPVPVEYDNYGIEANILHGVFDPIIQKAAKKHNATLIDCYTPLLGKKGITTDGVHPSVKGMQAIAAVVYKGLMGKEPPAELVAELAKEWQAADAKRKAAEEAKRHQAGKARLRLLKVLKERAKTAPKKVTLTVDIVRDLKGDGPDGKGNTDDDSWQFWFELAHAPGSYGHLDLPTETMSASVRKRGIRKKVTGPIGSWMLNKEDTEGWIYHSDWDGRFEGVWGDKKANRVILYPYVEKGSHMAVAVSYLVSVAGKYTVTGKTTDLQVHPQFKQHDGASWRIEIGEGGKTSKVIARGGPFGDAGGRPDSVDVKAGPFNVKSGELVRLAIDPNKWWGSDMTKVELTIERVDK